MCPYRVVWHRSCFDNHTIPVNVIRNVKDTLAACTARHAIIILFKAVNEYAVYAYTYMHMHIYMHIHIHVHLHIHVHTLTQIIYIHIISEVSIAN